MNRLYFWIAIEALFQLNIALWRREDTRRAREDWAKLNFLEDYQ